MKNKIKWIVNSYKNSFNDAGVEEFSKAKIGDVLRFHQGLAGYQPTPLQQMTELAKELGIAGLYVKDESFRFGLNAFKVLGGSYAIGKYLASLLGISAENMSFAAINSLEARKERACITFVTATDGNHGRGVAWAAAQLGQKAVVYMPKGSSEERLNHIKAEGAEASITNLNYDDAVRLAAEQARKHGWVVIQDTAWEGYYDIPLWIMQGYATMAMEANKQMREKPTHIFLQAGVGSFAGAITGFFANLYPDSPPKVVIVEPNAADCLFQSAAAKDGQPRFIGGEMNTIMAGLACGEPNLIGWKILRNYSDMFISCPDWVSARGMRILGNPMGKDERVISGESGAVTTGIVSLLMTSPSLEDVRRHLELGPASRILVFSTEGDTDRKKYRRIVWDGEYPSVGEEE